MSKRTAELSPASFRDEMASVPVPNAANLLKGIYDYLSSLSDPERKSPLSLLLGTCAIQMNELLTRSSVSIDDVIEKDKRDRCVVVQGLSESSAMKPSERVADDLSRVISMLDHAGVEHSPATTFRMGVKSDSRPRLLKVMFHCRSAQKAFIAKSHTLTTPFPGVFVRPSQTKEEREKAFQLREKKRAMIKEGRDVVIFEGEIIERSKLAEYKKRRPMHSLSRTPIPFSSDTQSFFPTIPSLMTTSNSPSVHPSTI
ncbi:hypothetical protein DXG03_001213 [Asterophora parasitica]|uniref:Uncharacterized protein n=1 Tax=Asterophora parasitica TaxID=117018 RepID=A0A9P7FZC8_9AGAR|nr:hypothetical protein DXG03_001213 [Asterophora parasitica]